MTYCYIVQNVAIWNIWKICWQHWLKVVWKYLQRSVNSSEPNYNTWVAPFLLKKNESVLKTRLEVIQKLKPPNTAKGHKSFAGEVNYLSMFCPNLHMHLKHIYDLTRKDRPFIWTKQHQEAFEFIKARLLNPPSITSTRQLREVSIIFRH